MLESHPNLMPKANQRMCAFLADCNMMMLTVYCCAHAELCKEAAA